MREHEGWFFFFFEGSNLEVVCDAISQNPILRSHPVAKEAGNVIQLCVQDDRERVFFSTPVGELCSILASSCVRPGRLLWLTFLQSNEHNGSMVSMGQRIPAPSFFYNIYIHLILNKTFQSYDDVSQSPENHPRNS